MAGFGCPPRIVTSESEKGTLDSVWVSPRPEAVQPEPDDAPREYRVTVEIQTDKVITATGTSTNAGETMMGHRLFYYPPLRLSLP